MESSSTSPQYSPFLRRFAAALIDGLILLIPSIALGAVLPYVGGLVIWLLYAPIFESSPLQGTPGKKVMGMRVIGANGATLSFATAILRSLMKFGEGLLLCLPYLLALFTDKKQALHDIVADTVVVEGAPNMPVVEAWVQSFQTVFGLQKSGSSASGVTGSTGTGDSIAALERLTALYERGALSKEEFEAEKRKILGSV